MAPSIDLTLVEQVFAARRAVPPPRTALGQYGIRGSLAVVSVMTGIPMAPDGVQLCS